MVFIMVPFFFLQFNDPRDYDRRPRAYDSDSENTPPRNAEHTWSSSWQIFLSALLPFILTTLTLGDFEDVLTFMPVLILSILTTRNSVSDFLVRLNPSILIMLVLAVPSLYQMYLAFSSPSQHYPPMEVKKVEIAESKEEEWNLTLILNLFFTLTSIITTFFMCVLMAPSTRLMQNVPTFVFQWCIRLIHGLGVEIQSLSPGSLPASKQAISEIKNATYKVTEHDLLSSQSPTVTCAVCLDSLALGEVAVKFGCSHLFHPDCVVPWLQKHCTCPTCRFEIETDNALYEYQRKNRQKQGTKTYFATPQERKTSATAEGVNSKSLEELSISELKAKAFRENVDITGIFEKTELIEKLKSKNVNIES